MRKEGAFAVATEDEVCDDISESAVALVARRIDGGALTRLLDAGMEVGLCPGLDPEARGEDVGNAACADWLLPRTGICAVEPTGAAAETGRATTSGFGLRWGTGMEMRGS